MSRAWPIFASIVMLLASTGCQRSTYYAANGAPGSASSESQALSGNGEGYQGRSVQYFHLDSLHPCAQLGANGAPLPNSVIDLNLSASGQAVSAALARDACTNLPVPSPLNVSALQLGTDAAGNVTSVTYQGALFVPATPELQWTWVSGPSISSSASRFGTQGIASVANFPPGRDGMASWSGTSGSVWIFGGEGDFTNGSSYLNDLWKWDGTAWTWVSGSSVNGQSGNYGVKGVAAPANMPGAREFPLSWKDAAGGFWLFGGYAYMSGSLGDANDLWKWDGANWTWISGTSSGYAPGSYGVKGVPSASNLPPAREGAAGNGWVDVAGNFWLFGGLSQGMGGALNDLWKWDGTNWTWVAGGSAINLPTSYGAKGFASPANTPGGLEESSSGAMGNTLWLFGGTDYSGNDTNDLWKWDGTNWTWVSGSGQLDLPGVYGTLGTASPANLPGCRRAAAIWFDAKGDLFLYGGLGYDRAGNYGDLGDLWRFDGTSWTWLSGPATANPIGVYGPPSGNRPGGRRRPGVIPGAGGSLWLFGGWGYDAASGEVYLGDLWRFR